MRPEIDNALNILRSGGTILYPTDTVWGIGCDATDIRAVAKVSAIKGRSGGKSYIVLLADDSQLQRYVKEVPNVAWDILENTDKPITIIYPQGMGVAPEVLGNDGSIAIRITNDAFCQSLIRGMRRPLLSTSANRSGSPTAASLDEVEAEIRAGVDHIVTLPDRGRNARPSSIIKLGTNGEVSIIRR